MKREKTVSLCMIVKNEEKYLANCLNSVKDIVDEMIIVDTGSNDKTLDIANTFPTKIFHYEWDNHFSNARNFAISKATCDWILLLDGDEVFEVGDKDKFIQFVNTSTSDGCHFIVYNYSNELSDSNASLHYAFRLLRNNNQYHFVGSIHEQIVRIDNDSSLYNLANESIRLHHYGYLDNVIKEKDKRSRNIPIIMTQLESDPHNAFYLFNLGNEYLSSKDFKKALDIYTQSYQYIHQHQAFVPHLFYRMLMCSYSLKLYDKAIEIANEALSIYPNCTDIEYCKGMIFYATHKYTLAIDSFNRCLLMGEPPATLMFSSGCGTFRPYIFLGEIYTYLDDFDQAIGCFNKALEVDPSLYGALYQVAHVLRKKYPDQEEVCSILSKYFSSLDYLPNLLVYTDILIKEQLYDSAKEQIIHMNLMQGHLLDRLFLTSKLHFFMKEYDLAIEGFKELTHITQNPAILSDIKLESTKFLFTCYIIKQQVDFSDILNSLNTFQNIYFEKVYLELYNMYSKSDATYLTDEDSPEICLSLIMEFLDKLLKAHEFDLFEQYLYMLNKINSKEVLLYLAKLYYNNQFTDMAIKTILRSIKELDTIDHECLDILSHEI